MSTSSDPVEVPIVDTSYLRLPDGTVWPNPGATGELEWLLRYGNPNRKDLLHAASVVAAYRRALGTRSPSPSDVGSLTAAGLLVVRRMIREVLRGK